MVPLDIVLEDERSTHRDQDYGDSMRVGKGGFSAQKETYL